MKNYNQTGAKSQEGHSIVKTMGVGDWLDSLGSGILVGKINFDNRYIKNKSPFKA